MEVLIPFVTASIIDRGIEAGDIHQVYLHGGVMLAMALLSLMFGVLAGRYAAKASSGLACNLREGIYEKVQSFAFSNIDSYSAAGLVTRMTTDVTNVHNACQMILRIAVRAPLMLVCSMVMCFFISAKLSTIFLAAIVILAAALASVALIYGAGILCAYAYNRIMVTSARAPCAASARSCSSAWSACPSAILTPMPTATSCPSTPTMWTPCGSSWARVSPRSSAPA